MAQGNERAWTAHRKPSSTGLRVVKRTAKRGQEPITLLILETDRPTQVNGQSWPKRDHPEVSSETRRAPSVWNQHWSLSWPATGARHRPDIQLTVCFLSAAPSFYAPVDPLLARGSLTAFPAVKHSQLWFLNGTKFNTEQETEEWMAEAGVALFGDFGSADTLCGSLSLIYINARGDNHKGWWAINFTLILKSIALMFEDCKVGSSVAVSLVISF